MTRPSYKEDGLTIPRLAQAGQPCRQCVHAGGGVGMGRGDLNLAAIKKATTKNAVSANKDSSEYGLFKEIEVNTLPIA